MCVVKGVLGQSVYGEGVYWDRVCVVRGVYWDRVCVW